MCKQNSQENNDHHDRFTFLSGQWGLVRTCEFTGKGLRQTLQSSAICFKSWNNSPLILIFLLFPDQGQDSSFSCHWNFSPMQNSRKRVVLENDHFITCEVKQLGNALGKDIPRLKWRKWSVPDSLHLLLSLTFFPWLNLCAQQYLVPPPLCDSFHLCSCVGITILKYAAVLNLSLTYSFVTPTVFHPMGPLAAGESLWEQVFEHLPWNSHFWIYLGKRH